MTANQHPYPAHIVEALADAAFPHDLDGIERANHALAALWEASQVDYLPQVEVLPDDAVVQTADGLTEFARTMKWLHSESAYPAHVIYWGNRDR